MELLQNIAWAFNDTDYATQEAFNEAVHKYQLAIMDENSWNPEERLVDAPEVEIVYEYWVTENDAVFEDETEVGDEDEEIDEEEEEDDEEDEDEDTDDEDGEQKEVAARFKADNGQYFTAGELLYKLHQRLRHRELGDHVFFEGFYAFGDSEKKETPIFYVYCGS